MSKSADVIVCGGGLAGLLTAACVTVQRPDLRVLVIERAAQPGGDHTWSFHPEHLPPSVLAMLTPFLARRWDQHAVRFPDQPRRVLPHAYATLTSDGLRGLSAQLGLTVRTDTAVVATGRHHVDLAEGQRLQADVVLDARGPSRITAVASGYQKFVGIELATDQPVDDACPDIMDATVPQHDGFRFVYVLPLGPHRVLIEDTYYSDSPDLDVPVIRARLAAYATARGLEGRIVREERGCLPLPATEVARWPEADAAFPIGYGALHLHPTTGYSLPMAARIAVAIATYAPALEAPALRAQIAALARQQRFGLLLNRLLFKATPPEARWHVMARFYRLPTPVIQRFYGLDQTRLDRMRVVCGRPPKGTSIRASLFAGATDEPLRSRQA